VHKITGKQCKAARALLKWNLSDLANTLSGIVPRRIESFERGMVHLAEWENKDMVASFKKEGIAFRADMEVVLHTDRKEERLGVQVNGAHVVLDVDQTVLADSTVEPDASAASLLQDDVPPEAG